LGRVACNACNGGYGGPRQELTGSAIYRPISTNPRRLRSSISREHHTRSFASSSCSVLRPIPRAFSACMIGSTTTCGAWVEGFGQKSLTNAWTYTLRCKIQQQLSGVVNEA
jgi:hypothetical protein